MTTVKRAEVGCRLLWLVALSATGALAYWRYRELENVTPAGPSGNGGDFWTYLYGARQISAGRGLYSFSDIAKGFGYVYSPLLAVVLIPFSAAATVHVWHVFTALAIAFLVLFAVLVTMTRAPYLQSWRQPVFFGFASFTVLVFIPTEVELSNGQTDSFVLVFLAAAVLAAVSGWPAVSGMLTGVGGLLKTWPVVIALAFFRRGYRDRLQALTGLVAILMVGPVLALATGGISGLVDFFKVTIDARSQQLVSYSVWGVPKILFSRSGLARPLLVSFPLQAAVTVTLAALVAGLLVLGLRWGKISDLGFWHVAGCVVLILPVSHSAYTLYLLPLFWIWGSRWLAVPRFSGLVAFVAALLALWWLALFHKQWGSGSLTGSSLRYSVLFFANLAAVALSTIADLFLHVRAAHRPGISTPIAAHRLSASGRPAPRHAAGPPRWRDPSTPRSGRVEQQGLMPRLCEAGC